MSSAVNAWTENVPVAGAELGTDVVVAGDQPRPVLLMRTPYGRGTLRTWYDPIGLARSGWAVVLQDVRGRGESTGSFRALEDEALDGQAVIEWCARQPWSDGRVAMFGGSYVGAVQWLAASRRPDALKAIVPQMSAAEYRDDWTFEGGALRYGFLVTWALTLASGQRDITKGQLRQLARIQDRWSRTGHPGLSTQDLAELVPGLSGWTDYESPHWAGIDVQRLVRRLDVPAYHLAGWYDVFCEGSIRAFQALRRLAPSAYTRASQRLVIGPWTHMAPLMPMTAHLDFGAKANGVTEGVPGEQLQFVRDAIDGKPTVSGVRAFVMGTNSWIDLDDWPPPSTATRLWLDVDGEAGRANVGALNWQRPRLTGTDRYRHDADNPVPTMGGRSMNAALPVAGPMDQSPVESRPDVLVYSTRPLTHNLTLAGPVSAQIGFQSSAEQADVTVKLVDVYRDGRAINIADSVRRVRCRPGEPQLVSVDVGSTAITFRRGHRIRVEIASSNFPRFDVLGSAEQAVHRGGPFASYVELPVYGANPNGGAE